MLDEEELVAFGVPQQDAQLLMEIAGNVERRNAVPQRADSVDGHMGATTSGPTSQSAAASASSSSFLHGGDGSAGAAGAAGAASGHATPLSSSDATSSEFTQEDEAPTPVAVCVGVGVGVGGGVGVGVGGAGAVVVVVVEVTAHRRRP